MTGATLGIAAPIPVGVRFSPSVAIPTASLASGYYDGMLLSSPPLHIHEMRHRFQVPRMNAGTPAATVIYLLTFGNRAVEYPVGPAVRIIPLRTVEVDIAVADLRYVLPEP